MQIIRGKVKKAEKVIVYGPEGIGKSTLASRFPDPLFIDTEDSTVHMDVARTDKPTSWNMLMSQVQFVRDNPGLCKTLVIDTADWAEKLCADHLCAKHQKSGIEEFGYGKGYVYLEEEFGRLLNLLNDVVDRGINVVFTAHAQMRKFEQPGEAGSYDRWELKLEKKTAPLLKEWAFMVLFCNYETFIVNVDGQGVQKGRNIAQGGKRVIYTTHNPCWDAKNRHDLPEKIPMEWAAIAHCFESESAASTTTPAPPAEEQTVSPEYNVLKKAAQDAAETELPPKQDATSDTGQALESTLQKLESQADEIRHMRDRQAATTRPQGDDLEAAGVPRALVDLMRTNGVTLEEIQKVVADRGYFPADTPFRNYPPDFVEGVLIGAWPQVFKAIEEARILEAVPFK